MVLRPGVRQPSSCRAAYGWTTGGNGLGPVSVGYKGGVGDHFGYTVLFVAAVISFGLGIASLAMP